MSRGYNARRKARRQEARATAQPPRRANPSRRFVPLLPALAIALALAATAVVGIGAGDGTSREQVKREVAALLAGIPQDGITLGSPNAPITLEMYGDLECPTVRMFAENYLPSILNTWVRAGTVNLIYRSLKSDTDDERVFYRQEVAALAAGRQDKMWNYALTFIHEQDRRYTDYATDEFLTGIALQVPGLRRKRWRIERNDPFLWKRVALDGYRARTQRMSSTPSFSIHFNTKKAEESGLYRTTLARKEFVASFKEAVRSLRNEAFNDEPSFGVVRGKPKFEFSDE